MRYIELVEVPIKDLDIIGEPVGTRGGERDTAPKDVAPIMSPKGKEKIIRVYEKTPHDFLFYVLGKQPGHVGSTGIIDIETAKKLIGRKIEEIKRNPNAITIIYRHNVTGQANYVPLTSWILGHRIVHTLQSASFHKPYDDSVKLYNDTERLLYELIYRLAEVVYDYPISDIPKSDPISMSLTLRQGHSPFVVPLIHSLFTMRSARRKRLPIHVDHLGELMAQYLIKGKINFNKLPEHFPKYLTSYHVRPRRERNKKQWKGSLKRGMNYHYKEEKFQEANKLIDLYEERINQDIRRLFESMQGKIFVF